MTAQQQCEILRKELNEQQWRVFLGTEALKIGYGGISLVAKLSGADWKTVPETDLTLQRDLEELLEPKGDPMSLIKWTTHSLTHLTEGPLPSHGIASKRRRWPRCSTRRAIRVIRQQENAGRRFSCRPRSAVWAHHDPVSAV